MLKVYSSPLARLLIAHIFLLAGISKLGAGYAGTQGYMEHMGVPGMLLPLVIALEIGGAIALIVGWQTKWASYALAAFTLLSAILFHSNFEQVVDKIMFMKNIAIVGGLLLLAEHGAGAFSLDNRQR